MREINKILENALTIQLLIFNVKTSSTRHLSEDEFITQSKTWIEEGASAILYALDKSGYTIVPKEKSFNELLSQ